MEITFSHSIGFYPEKNNAFWLKRRSQTLVTISSAANEPEKGALVLKFTAGPAELYSYFPFLVSIYLNGLCREIVEFSEPFESHTVLMDISVGQAELAIHSEQGSIPARKGINPDERELAILMEWELREPSPDRLSPVSILPPSRLCDATASVVNQNFFDLPRPIFVIGVYRSGTSILTWALGRHPNIFPMEETGWLGPTAYGMLTGLDLAGLAKRSFLDVYDTTVADMMRAFGALIDKLMKATAEKHIQRARLARLSGLDFEYHPDFAVGRSLEFSYSRWVDGTPENTGYAYLLRKLFPRAQFIHIVRDPVDVVSSLTLFDRAGGDPIGVEEALKFWLRFTEWGLHLTLACGSEVVKTVPYKSLAEAPTAVLDEIFSFLGEPRFQQAQKVFRNRINSSSVTQEERNRIKEQLTSASAYIEAQNLYQECLKLASSKRIAPDPESERILADQINWVETTLLNIFSGKTTADNQ